MLYFPISCYFPWPCFFRSASRSPASTFFVDLGGGGGVPALCLNFGPSSELGVNGVVGSQLHFHGIFSFVSFFRILLHSMPGLLQLPQICQRIIFLYVILRRVLPFRCPPPFTKYGGSQPQSRFVKPASFPQA